MLSIEITQNELAIEDDYSVVLPVFRRF